MRMEPANSLPTLTSVSQSPHWISEGVILAMASVAANAVALAYEWGYLSAMGIPPSFIQLTLADLLVRVTAILILAAAILPCVDGLLSWFASWQRPVVRCLAPVCLLAFVAGRTLVIASAGAMSWVYLAMGLLLFFAALRIAYVPNERRGPTPSLFVSAIRHLGARWTIAFAWFIAAFLLAFPLGRHHATTETRFLVMPGSPPRVVLRTYGEVAITLPYDPTTGLTYHRLLAVKVTEGGGREMEWQDIGPLKLRNPATTAPSSQPTADRK